VSQCVCVSVTFVNSVKTNSPSGGYATLVIPHQMAWQFSHGNPPILTGASVAGGVGRNRESELHCVL